MSSNFDFDLIVIGAGSGGVRASRVASSHGDDRFQPPRRPAMKRNYLTRNV